MRLPARAGGRLALLLALPALAACGSQSRPPRGRGLVAIGAGLSGPSGMKARVYASGLRNVSAFTLDSSGRLWATTSGADDHSHDGVYLVTAAGARPLRVISGLRGPLGLAWYRDTLYVASIGRVDAFSGLRGTRFAQRRTVLREPSGHGWNDNLVVSPGGRLVMSISASCDHCSPRSPWSGAIVSFRPDGGDVRFYARRLRAGYGLAYVPGTSRLLVTMNQRNDLGSRTPGDWLAEVREGESWGFPSCYGQGGYACRGVPGPIAVLDKHAAAGGLAVTGTGALVSEWQLGVVKLVSLAGGRVQTYLSGLKNPLALATSRDGALLVGDWGSGTIYKVTR